MALLANNLLPATFRGVPFGVMANETGGGRRVALHQYPGRDAPWAEDMGRSARTFRFRGFITTGDVVFVGGPIQLQRALLLSALERSGPGALTHPTLGLIDVSVTRFSLGEDLGAGRFSTVDLEFVESGKRLFPSLLSSSSGLLSAANLGKLALIIDAVRVIALASSHGGRRRDVTVTAAIWSTKVLELGGDATAVYRLAAQLPGNYGRYSGGGNAGAYGTRQSATTTRATVPGLVALASASRATIIARGVALGVAIGSTDLSYPTDLMDAAIALVAALVNACADPADAIRLLSILAAFVPGRPEALSAIGIAFSRAMRRAAGAALVGVVGNYQPTSADDAASLILRLGKLFDALATEAADAGDDESFTALRNGRGAIIQDLRKRGATLAQLKMWRQEACLPSLHLAQRFYRDAGRAEQLERQAQAPHPLFMPLSLLALAA